MPKTEPEITIETAGRLGLSPSEFARIQKQLGREPSFTELEIFSVLWSERYSLKSSIKLLKTLPRENKHNQAKRRLQNAGLLEFGNGLLGALQFKSFLLPADSSLSLLTAGMEEVYCDLSRKGIRPAATLFSIRYGGDPQSPEVQHRSGQVIKAVYDFAGLFDAPVANSEICFEPLGGKEVLVSFLAAGWAASDQAASPSEPEPGSPVFIADSSAGGSKKLELTQSRDTEHPPVQQLTGLFEGKKLLEACLELTTTEAHAGMQCVDTAGIVRSAARLCYKTGAGMVTRLEEIPHSQTAASPSDIPLTEIPGRMLVIGRAGKEPLLHEVFEKWDIKLVQVGEVTDNGLLSYFFHDEKIAEIPVASLVPGKGAPSQERPYARPAYLSKVGKFHVNQVKPQEDLKEAAKKLFASPNLIGRRLYGWQSASQAESLASDAAVLQAGKSKKIFALTLAGNADYVYADPFAGSMMAVAEAARSIVCSGGIPLTAINCLNFGDADNPGAFYHFIHAIKGIGDACRKFNISVAGNDVSFFAPSPAGAEAPPIVQPAPVLGMLGGFEDPELQTTLSFKKEGDLIYMLGNSYNDLGSSQYLRVVHGLQQSMAPVFDLHEEFEIQHLVKKLIRNRIVRSAHSVSAGGLFTNLLESAIAGSLGFEIETVETFRKDCYLFGESHSRIVITILPQDEDELQNYLINNNVSFTKLGEVFGNRVLINNENFGSVNEWKRINDEASMAIFGR